MKQISCVLVVILLPGLCFATGFEWKVQGVTLQSTIPGNWVKEEQAQKYGDVISLHPPEGYATLSVTAFASKGTTSAGFTSLAEVKDWVNKLEIQNGDKFENQNELSSGILAKSNASEGEELHYSWVNQQGVSGRTILRILSIKDKFYEFRLLCSDKVWQSESAHLSKYLDSIHLAK